MANSHTLQTINNLPPFDYKYLHENLPSLKRVNEFIERTNYYSAKGIMQIELRTYCYNSGRKKYYLVLRYNPSIIMGDSKVFVVDSSKYTVDEILERIRKRLYEINEFRYIKLHKYPLILFRTSRADIAEDVISIIDPRLIVWLCNMTFPYKYRRMKRKPIKKDANILYFESCCFCSKSREVNIYHKWIAMINTGQVIQIGEEQRIKAMIRFEIQIKKKGIEYLATKLPTKKSIQQFLDQDFCLDYLTKEIKAIFRTEKYVSRSKAEMIINSSSYKPYEKAVMLSIIDSIQRYNGLYELEKAIDDKNICTPSQYGDLRSFRNRWLTKIRGLGIQPVVIPDSFGTMELPSIYNLFITHKGMKI